MENFALKKNSNIFAVRLAWPEMKATCVRLKKDVIYIKSIIIITKKFSNNYGS